MSKTVKIKDKLFVNVIPAPVHVAKAVETPSVEEEATNQFIILDRSGSMHYYLRDVVEQVKDYVKSLPEGSTVSVGYFSGTNQYNISVPFVLKKEISGLVSLIDTYRFSLGATNFVQILDKLNVVVGKEKASLFFFTDGCHNTGGSRSDIEKALRKWSDYSNVSVFVGHGYIDRDMMSWMASITNGSFVHLNSFADFRATLNDFGDSVADTFPTIPVALSKESCGIKFPISMSGKNIVEYEIEGDIVKFKPSKKGYRGLFCVSESALPGADVVTFSDLTKTEQATFSNALRALALVHSQKNDVNTSLALLNYLGDKYLIRNLYNSITPEEFSNAETLIRRSVFQPKNRFLEGEVHDFLPDDTAFCVLDAINILAKDEGVLIHLNDPDFEYNRIGKSTTQLDGSSLVYDKDISAEFSRIVMNQERLNLGLSTVASAVVPLDPSKFTKNPFTKDDLTKLGLGDTFPVSVFRTYSVIADGKVQTKKIVVSNLKPETIQALSQIIVRRADGKYIVSFDSIPVINRTYVQLTSGKKLAESIWNEKVMTDQLAILNNLKKSLEVTKVITNTMGVSKEAAEFLLDHCYIKNGLYNPPKSTDEASDEYEAYTFTVTFDGYSKASPTDVIKKMTSGKKPSARELIMEEAYNAYSSHNLDTLGTFIKEINKDLADLRSFIQASKFGIILGNRGKMDEFSSRENMTLDLNVTSLAGKKLSVKALFDISKITVKI